MFSNNTRQFVLTTALLGTLLSTDAVLAHDLTSTTLGGAATATDTFSVQCFNDGGGAVARVAVQVARSAGSVPVNVTALKGIAAVSASSNGPASPSVSVPAGNGTTVVVVSKGGAGAVQYSGTAHCEAADGAHTGTNVVSGQNQ